MLNIAETVRHLQHMQTKRLATLFQITRRDGEIFRFTDHDGVITFDGESFLPSGADSVSARRWETGAKPSSVEIRGTIDSDAITTSDLHARRFDDARVDEMVVDWRFPHLGYYIAHVWWFDQTRFTGEAWTIEGSGAARHLRRKAGETIARNCTHVLGDGLCKVVLASFTVTGSVLGTEDGDKRLVVYATGFGSFDDGYFADGFLTWTSGANNGATENVKLYTDSKKRIELQAPMPHTIAVGDTFSLTAGCDRLYTTCDAKFSNTGNYQGARFMPGSDRSLQTPRVA